MLYQLSYFRNMSFLSDSNQRPTDYKSVALPTELRKLIGRVFSKTLSVHVPPPLDSFLRSQPLQVHLLRIFIHPGVQYRLRGEVSWAPTSIALDATFGLRVLQPPSDWLDSVLKYKYYFLNLQVLVGEERLELSCDQLLFLQGISLRRYTPVFSWKGRIRTAVPVREQIYSLPVLTTHPPSIK